MVCVILLASAALLGTFGIMKRQISAVLITGVMYILAGNAHPNSDVFITSTIAVHSSVSYLYYY